MPVGRLRLLEEQRAEAQASATAILDAHPTGPLTPEAKAQFDGFMAQITGLDDDIKREQALKSVERAVPSSDTVRVTAMHDRAEDMPWGQKTGHAFGEFLQAVRDFAITNKMDPRLRNRTVDPQGALLGANETFGTEGGFLVGRDTQNQLMLRLWTGELLSRVRRISASSDSNTVVINYLDETSRANGSRFGGVTSAWLDEGATLSTGGQPRFGRMMLSLHRIGAVGYATNDALRDAALLESTMLRAFEEELRFRVEDSIINGDGTAKPKGILQAAARTTVAAETNQQAGTIVMENILNMYANFYAPSFGNAVWLINQEVIPQLITMAMPIGTGGVPVYLPPGGLTAAPFGTLMGRPVIPVEYCAAKGTEGDIILVDLNEYIFFDKGGVRTDSSMHVQFLTDQMAFRVIYRCDGKLSWNAPLTVYKGSIAPSVVVTLAAR